MGNNEGGTLKHHETGPLSSVQSLPRDFCRTFNSPTIAVVRPAAALQAEAGP